MYSFAQRADTLVIDEPLYGHYLRVSGVRHPGREEVLAAVDTDGERVVREVILGPSERPVLFMKHMAHHLVSLGRKFLQETVNVLLIRDPREVLASLVHQLPNPSLADTGVAMQSELLEQLESRGRPPVVLDSRELLLDPSKVLAALCETIGIDFDSAMLSWHRGARPEDGVWAPHWYESVHRSTGFAPYRPKTEPFAEHLLPLLAECRPHYDRLYERAIRAGG
ncbi:MAG: sulfotransferase family protein [Acidobacteria bacterium]|nr:sulfotransferase family protein [Acidobacteriota bacterium]